jgi:branched-chain amino acid transport system substrate-binding protein
VAGRAIERHGSRIAALTEAGVAVALALAVVLAGPSCRSSPKTIPLGAYVPLTGQLSGFGESSEAGAEMAVREINSAGGIGGKLLEMTVLDDEGDPQRAQDQVRRLVESLGVAAVLGGATSGNSLAAAPICQRNGVPMVSPSSTNPEVTEAGDFIFRVCYVDSFQGTAMATFAFNSLRITTVAIMAKGGDEYSEGLAEYFARTFESLGGTVVADVPFPERSTLLGSSVAAALEPKPQALFLPLYYQDVAAVARKVDEMGADVRLLGGDGWDSPELLRLAGDVLDGGYFTTHFSPDDRRAEVRTFVMAYRDRYDATPDAIAALWYDAAGLVADALRRLRKEDPSAFNALCWAGAGGGAGELSGARGKLRDMIAATTNYKGVTGDITIDESRNALKPAVVLQVTSEGIRYAGIVRP